MRRLSLILSICLCLVLIARYIPAEAYSLDDYLKPDKTPKMEVSQEDTLLSVLEASKLIIAGIENEQINTTAATVLPENDLTQLKDAVYPLEASLNINGVQVDLTATVIPTATIISTATVLPENDLTQLKDTTYSLEASLNISGVQTDLTATIISENTSTEPNCAAYSLGTSLNINGIQADLTQLSQELAPFTRADTQTSFEGIVKVAEEFYGVDYYGGQLTFKELKSSGSGSIVNLDLGNDWGHYVVYDDFEKGRVTYWDEGELSSAKKKVFNDLWFTDSWSGYALTRTPTGVPLTSEQMQNIWGAGWAPAEVSYGYSLPTAPYFSPTIYGDSGDFGSYGISFEPKITLSSPTVLINTDGYSSVSPAAPVKLPEVPVVYSSAELSFNTSSYKILDYKYDYNYNSYRINSLDYNYSYDYRLPKIRPIRIPDIRAAYNLSLPERISFNLALPQRFSLSDYSFENLHTSTFNRQEKESNPFIIDNFDIDLL